MKHLLHGILFLFSFIIIFGSSIQAQHSIARDWNEALLEAIRNDFARPTVHARNLFHQSIVLYDAWAAYEPDAETYLLGKTYGNYTVNYTPITIPTVESDRLEQQKRAMCFAAFRLMAHRFQSGISPGYLAAAVQSNQVMIDNGYNTANTSTDYQNGGGTELGNYLAQEMIAAGLLDGSNESNDYANQYYTPSNTPLTMAEPGNPNMANPNNWQQLELETAVDQSGNPISSIPDFLSPEWGNIVPFSLTDDNKTVYTKPNGDIYNVYYDPGLPPMLDVNQVTGIEDLFKWNFTLVNRWSSHHDPNDGVIWDISPASIGNVQSYPTEFSDYNTFYDVENGGDSGMGRSLNPITNQPYTPQLVPRGDYTRVLAEFWADGPDSETPPGHWFDILNYVNDNPLLVKKWQGTGELLNNLEWDVKCYLTLGGAMHDAAITAWGCKGWYDYVRPVSAIRYMAEQGQSSDPAAPNFHPAGLPLIPGYIEQVQAGDPLAADPANIGKVKLYTWKGPDYIANPAIDMAGVDWILAENWWSYQRPSFVSPPFAGYVSGHSTYSRAAAEVLTAITNSEYFPGGMGEFSAPQNNFLVFEEGPSVDITLQWASYRDASDQCSLSRIWGGIHPPVDDIPGRLMGEKVGLSAFEKANTLFNGDSIITFKIQNVWLEGFYDSASGLMRRTLQNSELVPNNQVYSSTPWNYSGTENLAFYPDDFVDWIYVCVRDQNGNILASKNCCLHDDGTVYGTIGNDEISFTGFDPNADHLISIHHRNHLAVIQSVSSGGVFDLANSNATFGIEATKLIAGKEMLYAGDFDGNGVINNQDFNIWSQNSAIVNTYSPQDADGNTVVNNADFNLWTINRSKVGEPIIYY